MAQQPLESIWTSRIDQRPGQLGAIIFAALISAGCGGSDTSGSSGQSGTQSYSVGGAISGLVGSGLVLSNNASDTVAVSANGAFTFASSLAAAGTYSVTIVSQPVNPSQTCSVGNGNGSVGNGIVTNVAITCVTHAFRIMGSVSGLQGSQLTLQSSGGDTLSVAPSATGFTFATTVASGMPYAVTVLTQPVGPAERCTVTNGSGLVGAADVTNVQIACAGVSSSPSSALIDAALQAGTINLETAIQYKMFALFKDARLPPSFQGDDSDALESDAFDLTYDHWSSLSATAQQTLLPFLVPPVYKGSWASQQSAGGSARAASIRSGTQALATSACQAPEFDANWNAKLGARSKVWYDTRIAGADAQASFLRDELETHIWPTIVNQVGMKEPLGDTNLRGCNGGDGLFDIYLVDMAADGQTAGDLGETISAQGPARKQAPVFILLNRTLSNDVLKGTLAHEFTHASQWAYPVAAASLSSYGWLKESTAQEAIDVVYQTLIYNTCRYTEVNQLEQCKAVPFMKTPERSLDDLADPYRVYGSYLFFQFLVKTNAPTMLASVWNSTTSQSDQLKAVDAAIPGGFQTQWPLFAKQLWNQPPVDINSFAAWDQLMLTPTPRTIASSSSSAPIALTLGGQPTASYRMDGNISHLATHYYRFKVSDSNVRSLLFDNHILAADSSSDRRMTTQAFYLMQGGTWQYAKWSGGGTADQAKFFCLDVASERIEELVIAMSNDSFSDDILFLGDDYQPRVSISNAGCWQYAGSVSVEYSRTDAIGDYHTTQDATVTFQRSTYPAPLVNGVSGPLGFQVLSGTLNANENDRTTTGDTLVLTASGPIPLDSKANHPTLSVDPGFDRIGLTPSPQKVTASDLSTPLTTHTVSTTGGVRDAHDNVIDWQWLSFPPSDSQQTVLLQSGGLIAGTYTDSFGNKYTWQFAPKRQP